MRTTADPLRQVERFQLYLESAGGRHVLVRGVRGELEWFEADSMRHQAMAESSHARRIIGVFDASAGVPVIAAAVREVR